MRTVSAVSLACLAVLVTAETANCKDVPGGAVKAAARADEVPVPPWLVTYDAVKDQPIGMDEADIRAFHDKQLKSEWRKRADFAGIWSNLFLLGTPARKVDVPAFRISKYEVSNAQWAKFLDAHVMTAATEKDETLEALAVRLWRLNPESQRPDIQRGWKTLLRVNKAVLMPVLDPKQDPKWDPLAARASEQKLPKGLAISYPMFLPPLHWSEDGILPDAERRRPMRYVSWEQAVEFCRWAGFHLPTEYEWERAARGAGGRWFPWSDENTWDPMKLRWDGQNDALERAKKPGLGEGPVDVDALAETANPEGVLHLLGNVAELTSSRSVRYPDSKSTWRYGGDAVVARGGSYMDKAEVLFSAFRHPEIGGALFASSMADSLGFRLASYPTDGPDATLTTADRCNDTIRGPLLGMPPAPGIDPKTNKDAANFLGFDAQLSAGIIERQLAADSPDHVFVTGPATTLAFLPVKGFPVDTTKTVGDLTRHAKDPDRLVVLGILTGSLHSAFGVEVEGAKGLTWISFDDKLFHYTPPDSERIQTTEHLGAALAWDGSKVVVYEIGDTLKSVAKYRMGLLGTLPVSPEVRTEKGMLPPSGRIEGETAVLEVSIPMLDRNARPMTGGAAFRITIKVPFKRQAK